MLRRGIVLVLWRGVPLTQKEDHGGGIEERFLLRPGFSRNTSMFFVGLAENWLNLLPCGTTFFRLVDLQLITPFKAQRISRVRLCSHLSFFQLFGVLIC